VWTSVTAVVTSLVAVAGTLLGGALQRRGTVRTERTTQVRQEQLKAFSAFAHALTVHRGRLYARWDLADEGAGAEQQEAARSGSWESRSELSRALVDVQLVADDPELLQRAEQAMEVAFALRDAVDKDDLDQRRDTSHREHDAFMVAARRVLKGL
jgi:hypothetical protein